MFLTKEAVLQAKNRLTGSPWKEFAAELREAADGMLSASLPANSYRSNQILFRSRFFTRAVVTLAGASLLFDDLRYAHRAWALMEESIQWEGWCAEPNGTDGKLQVDLSVGEMCFAFANALPLLKDYLTSKQRAAVVEALDRLAFKPYLAAVSVKNPEELPWWYLTTINWNSVTNGGIYCAALYLAEECETAKVLLPYAERGLSVFAENLHRDGSCEEGIGYWLYGVMFLSYALTTYENITGNRHAWYDDPSLKLAVEFPFDFSPYAVGLSFGDVNWFRVTGGLYALLNRIGRKDMSGELTERLLSYRRGFDRHPIFEYESCYMWPHEIFAVAFCDVPYTPGEPMRQRPPLKVYPDNGWGIFKTGNTYLSFRSGSSDVNHGCRDLNAISLSKNGVRLIENVGNMPYPLGWFGENRKQFMEDSTLTKSSMLVNGIGQVRYDTATFAYDETSMSSDATVAYPSFMKKVWRKVSLEGQGIRVEDRFENVSAECWHEIRFFTAGNIREISENTWAFEKDGQILTLHFTCDHPLYFGVSASIPSIAPRQSFAMLRVSTLEAQKETSIETYLE